MKLEKFLIVFLIICLLFLNCWQSFAQALPSGLTIWFTQPASSWNEALPVGNGRLGAMIFGGVENEHIELNESSVWTGEPRWDANPEALKTLPKVRRLLFQGKYKEAEELAQKKILGMKPQNPAATYQALGDIFIDFGPQRNLSNYRRDLNIENATASVTYSANQTNYLREIFSSAPDQAIIIRLSANKAASISFTLRLSRQGDKATITATGNEIDMNEHVGDGTGVKIFSRLKLVNRRRNHKYFG